MIIIMGSTAITAAAIMDPQGICPCNPSNNAMPTGIVLALWSIVNIKAKRNSLNEKINERINAENKPGKETGKIILLKIFNFPAPSINAALSRSLEIFDK